MLNTDKISKINELNDRRYKEALENSNNTEETGLSSPKKKKRKKIKRRSIKAIKARIIVFGSLAAFIVLISLIAPLIAPHDPNATNVQMIRSLPSEGYFFGTDDLGRCVLSRILIGSRNTIFASLALVALSFIFGSVVGMLSGYYGGILDTILMRITDILLSFPQMVLAIAVAGVLGGSMLNAMIALGITSWTIYARLARSQTMGIKNETYISSARLSGISDVRILFSHMLPNIVRPLLVTATTQIGTTMIGIAGLSFLGLGVVAPNAEWGSMISNARGYIQVQPWATLAPAIAMIITIVIFNLLGDAARDYSDVNGV